MPTPREELAADLFKKTGLTLCSKEESARLTHERTRHYSVTIRQQGPKVAPGKEQLTITTRAETEGQLRAILHLQAIAYQLTSFEIVSITPVPAN